MAPWSGGTAPGALGPGSRSKLLCSQLGHSPFLCISRTTLREREVVGGQVPARPEAPKSGSLGLSSPPCPLQLLLRWAHRAGEKKTQNRSQGPGLTCSPHTVQSVRVTPPGVLITPREHLLINFLFSAIGEKETNFTPQFLADLQNKWRQLGRLRVVVLNWRPPPSPAAGCVFGCHSSGGGGDACPGLGVKGEQSFRPGPAFLRAAGWPQCVSRESGRKAEALTPGPPGEAQRPT